MQNAPDIVDPYCGQNQAQKIVVPRTTLFHEEREESCWVLPPYSSIFPPDSQTLERAPVPPPVYRTDIFSAQQTFPL